MLFPCGRSLWHCCSDSDPLRKASICGFSNDQKPIGIREEERRNRRIEGAQVADLAYRVKDFGTRYRPCRS